MFRSPDKLTEKYSISEYIQNNDYFNSELLIRIRQLPLYDYYTINKYEYRIDLISSDIYGSSKYSQILLFYNGLSLSELKRGVVLKYPSLDSIEELIRDINRR